VTLKGMTITHGTGPGVSSVHRNGGGITSAYTDLTVKDAVVSGNSAFGNGGGISFVYGSLTVKDSVITNNTAEAYPDRPGVVAGGGGLRGGGVPNVLVVVDSVIAGNVSWGQGGGIITVSSPGSGALVVKDCLIIDNEAKDIKGIGVEGGGIYVDGTPLTVKDSDITDNIPDDFYPAL
jgi:predicted outer membrane repeat protein